MQRRLHIAALAVFSALLGPASHDATAASCEIDRPVRFAGLDWDSNRFHTAVAGFIAKHGYGCGFEIIPGTTIPLLTGLGRGDVDVMMEVWKNQLTEAWVKAEKSGKVKLLGVNFPDATQGWFVPRYVVEGEDAPAKGLESIEDLARYKDVFADPEEPGKGRFYNCKLGWDCEVTNTKKLRAYGLADDYVNFRTGSGAALAAAIASAYRRKEPILYYYWAPTWVTAKYDGYKLKEPPYDAQVWAEFRAREKPERATAFAVTRVYTGANTEFTEKAPRLTAFLRKYSTTSAIINDALVFLQDNRSADETDAAIRFLKARRGVWTDWVPEDVAERVDAALR